MSSQSSTGVHAGVHEDMQASTCGDLRLDAYEDVHAGTRDGVGASVEERALVERLAKTETSRFSTNEYRGAPDAPEFEFVHGTTQALVSAPHAVTHRRDGQIKPSEDYTGAIALELARRCGCHALTACRTGAGDPNWDALEASPYKQALVEYIREQGISLVVDLHGMVAASPALVAVGSCDGASVATVPGLDTLAYDVLCDRLAPWCELWEKPVVLNERYAARRETTVVQTVVRETGAAALQVEVATQLRVPVSFGHRVPKGERPPFRKGQLSVEVTVRRQPDPRAVAAFVQAMSELLEQVAPR